MLDLFPKKFTLFLALNLLSLQTFEYFPFWKICVTFWNIKKMIKNFLSFLNNFLNTCNLLSEPEGSECFQPSFPKFQHELKMKIQLHYPRVKWKSTSPTLKRISFWIVSCRFHFRCCAKLVCMMSGRNAFFVVLSVKCISRRKNFVRTLITKNV